MSPGRSSRDKPKSPSLTRNSSLKSGTSGLSGLNMAGDPSVASSTPAKFKVPLFVLLSAAAKFKVPLMFLLTVPLSVALLSPSFRDRRRSLPELVLVLGAGSFAAFQGTSNGGQQCANLQP